MAKGDSKSPFGEDIVGGLGVEDPRQGVGPAHLMIGRDSGGNPGIQLMGHFIPFSEFKQTSAGGKSGPDEDGDNDKKPGIKDIDYPVRGRKKQSIADVYRPKVQKTFKEGGMVRGAGCAQRGRGRGKMV